MPPSPETWDRSTSVRLPKPILDQVEDLRGVLGGVKQAHRSDVLLELITLGLMVLDVASAKRVGEYAARVGISRAQAWQRAIDVGIDALESSDDPESNE